MDPFKNYVSIFQRFWIFSNVSQNSWYSLWFFVSKKQRKVLLLFNFDNVNSYVRCQPKSKRRKIKKRNHFSHFDRKLKRIRFRILGKSDHLSIRTLKDGFFIVSRRSKPAQNVGMNPKFIKMIDSVMNFGFIPAFRAHSDWQETMKNPSLRVLF